MEIEIWWLYFNHDHGRKRAETRRTMMPESRNWVFAWDGFVQYRRLFLLGLLARFPWKLCEEPFLPHTWRNPHVARRSNGEMLCDMEFCFAGFEREGAEAVKIFCKISLYEYGSSDQPCGVPAQSLSHKEAGNVGLQIPSWTPTETEYLFLLPVYSPRVMPKPTRKAC